jgi:hypothetical protein
MRRSPAAVFTTLFAAMLAVSCAPTTKLIATWKDPTAATPLHFQKVLVTFQAKDQALRRSAESHLAQRIKNATPSYQVLDESEARDEARAKEKIAAAGFDGAVVVRFVGTTTQTTYVPGTAWWGPAPYGSMWGYWGYGWGAVYSPGYLTQDTIVTLEANVYSVRDDKLIWASRSRTVNAESMTSLLDSVLDATAWEMKNQKVL